MSTSFVLPRSTPESQGISSQAVLAFVEAVEAEIHYPNSMMLIKHGHVVAEGWWRPYAPEARHMLFSLSKSFASTAVGLAVGEGLLSIEDTVISFFPDKLPVEVSPNLAAMKVKHLLCMSTGHDVDTTSFLSGVWATLMQLPTAEDPVNGTGGALPAELAAGDWIAEFLARPVEHEPGTFFVYNTGATYILSAIVQRVTGQKILDYLRPRLFEPLGIADPLWQESPAGIDTGGWGLNIRTEDIARFGQLYLQKGMWQGRRLLAADWVEAAGAHQGPSYLPDGPDWQSGYGYQFWRCRHNVYRADGAFGQWSFIMPDQDVVLVMTDGTHDAPRFMELLWDLLLPALSNDEPLAPDVEAQQELAAKMAGLALPTPEGAASSPLAEAQPARTYALESNPLGYETLTYTFGPAGATLRLVGAKHSGWLGAGYGQWMPGDMPVLGARSLGKLAAAGAWSTPDTYVAQVWAYETPFGFTATSRFDGDQVTLELAHSVGLSEPGKGDAEGTPGVDRADTLAADVVHAVAVLSSSAARDHHGRFLNTPQWCRVGRIVR